MTSIDPNLNILDAQAKMCTLCDSYRDSMLFGHFTFGGAPWQCDEASRINILGAILFALANGNQLPPGFVFRDMNNVNHTVTGPYMIGMGETMMAYLSGVYAAGWKHKANILAMRDPIAVQEYDYMSSLWPNPDH